MLLFLMVIINPKIKKQLKDLGKIPYNKIKNQSCVIVDMPIGQMKSHDLGRALYVVTNAFTELTHKQQIIVKVIKQSQEDIKNAIEDDSLTKEELVNKIKKIALDPPVDEKHSLEDGSSQEKE
jgi:mRNA-degrading endonuclease RelE of RelBE toxin-antitoxin system